MTVFDTTTGVSFHMRKTAELENCSPEYKKDYIGVYCQCGSLWHVKRPECGYITYDLLGKCPDCDSKLLAYRLPF